MNDPIFSIESLPLPITPSGWHAIIWQRDQELLRRQRREYELMTYIRMQMDWMGGPWECGGGI